MKYNNENNERLNYFCDTNYAWKDLYANELYPLKVIEFEGLQMNVSNEVEKHLTQVYGNYMKMPPEEERKSHYSYQLDFGNYNASWEKRELSISFKEDSYPKM